jgi:putative ABC transport system permease protein
MIALPAAYIVMEKWLYFFAYRISVEWWMFALSGGITLFIGLLTVGFQSLKAASANSVDAIRHE